MSSISRVPPVKREQMPLHLRWNFTWATLTGMFFEGGAAFVNTSTVMAAFVSALTPSLVAVGATEVIARFGWLAPQLFAAYYAQRRLQRKAIYLLGGWGRAGVLALLALLLLARPPLSAGLLLTAFFGFWTLYSLVSGLSGAPYNDIIGRTIPPEQRSRLLAWRFFGGGLLAVGAGLAVRAILNRPIQWPFPVNYGIIFVLGAATLTLSTLCFALVREPAAPVSADRPPFGEFLRRGLTVVRADRRFRLFLAVQWLTGVTAMTFPFYILQAQQRGLTGGAVGTLLTAQMVGSLLCNPLWGWWGDHWGKVGLLRAVAVTSAVSPVLAIALSFIPTADSLFMLAGYVVVFFFLGAVSSGGAIADLGYLMEISPDDRRPAYSGYMNALVAPTRLLPLVAGGLAAISFPVVFGMAALAVLGRLGLLYRLGKI